MHFLTKGYVDRIQPIAEALYAWLMKQPGQEATQAQILEWLAQQSSLTSLYEQADCVWAATEFAGEQRQRQHRKSYGTLNDRDALLQANTNTIPCLMEAWDALSDQLLR